jgi:hypothetical protein
LRSLALRLAVIALLVYAGVSFWYGRVEERLQERPAPPAKQQEAPVQRQEAATPPDQAVQPQEKESAPASADYGVIVSRNIFQAGQGSAEHGGTSPAHGEEDGLEQTKLRLVLLGTVTGDSDDTRAIIRDEQTKLEDLYRTGSEIQGARINRISRGKVILSVNGREEVLTIKDPGSDDQSGGMAVPQAGTRRMEPVHPEAAAAPGGEIENKVPEAQPRRRISFRNAPPPPPAAEQPVQTAPGESPPLPQNGEVPHPDQGGEKPVEAPPPGQ